jgi:predicted O-methyltransferase YrrM
VLSNHQLTLELAKFRTTEEYSLFQFLNKEGLSMLHPDTLSVLNILNKGSINTTLEIGPCKGGSTIALCTNTYKKVISIENNHAHYRDSLDNYHLYDVHNQITLLQGSSYEPDIKQKVGELLDSSIGLFVVDSDGCVSRDLLDYSSFLDSHTLLVLDDYYSPHAYEKEHLVRKAVDLLIEQQAVQSLGVYGWGTWCGQLISKEKLKILENL